MPPPFFGGGCQGSFWVGPISGPIPFPISGRRTFSWGCQGRKKHINKCAGLCRDWVGGKNLFCCFWGVIPYGGEKHINKIPLIIPGQSLEILVCMYFSLCVVFAPRGGRLEHRLSPLPISAKLFLQLSCSYTRTVRFQKALAFH